MSMQTCCLLVFGVDLMFPQTDYDRHGVTVMSLHFFYNDSLWRGKPTVCDRLNTAYSNCDCDCDCNTCDRSDVQFSPAAQEVRDQSLH